MAKARPSPEQAVFPAPGHDHARCSTDAMTVAEARCIERGQRLTPIRRDDLAALLLSDQCGTVGEAASAEVASKLKAAARSAGFTPRSPVIEISGVCSHCGGNA